MVRVSAKANGVSVILVAGVSVSGALCSKGTVRILSVRSYTEDPKSFKGLSKVDCSNPFSKIALRERKVIHDVYFWLFNKCNLLALLRRLMQRAWGLLLVNPVRAGIIKIGKVGLMNLVHQMSDKK